MAHVRRGAAVSNAVTALGLCDGTPAWWAVWLDALTRPPAFKWTDVDRVDEFAESRGLDPAAVRAAVLAADVLPWVPNPRPAHPWSAGPVVRWPYRYEGGPAPTDGCGYEDWYDGWRCSGACGG